MINKSLKPGFNFIELMVALLIIGLIVTMIGPRVGSIFGLGRKTVTKNTLRTVDGAIKHYQMTVGRYPDKLEDLVKKPEGVSGWDGPYVGSEKVANPEVPLDGWGQELGYKLNPRGSVPPFDLWSIGDPSKAEEEHINAN